MVAHFVIGNWIRRAQSMFLLRTICHHNLSAILCAFRVIIIVMSSSVTLTTTIIIQWEWSCSEGEHATVHLVFSEMNDRGA